MKLPITKAYLALQALLVSAAIASAGVAQDPLTAYPTNYKLILDNEDVAVIRVHYGPHEKLDVHDHSKFPTVYVYLSDSGSVRYSHDEIPPFVITRPPVKLGSFRVSPGRLERHTVENLGDQSSDFLRIELKKLPLHNTLHPVRSAAPAKLIQGSKEEFSSPEITIRRIVCTVGSPCAGDASNHPTLLVAFSPLSIDSSEPAHLQRRMQSGDIQWIKNPQSLSITDATPAPAHLLEIEFHGQDK